MRYDFQYGSCFGKVRARTAVDVVKCITIWDKKYRTAGQAATTIAWILTDNILPVDWSHRKDWTESEREIFNKRREKLYKRARRRVLPICERLLK